MLLCIHADGNNDKSNKARRARGQWAGRRGRLLWRSRPNVRAANK